MEQSLTERKATAMLMSRVLAILLITLAMLTESGQSKPLQPELEPIDICIFTCDFCFQAEALVRCANECIALNGIMGPMWRKTCPYFGQQPIFPSMGSGKLFK